MDILDRLTTTVTELVDRATAAAEGGGDTNALLRQEAREEDEAAQALSLIHI